MFAKTRALHVSDAMIDDYVQYRRRVSQEHGAEPLYFQEWFDNLWQAQPVDLLLGHDD